MYLVIAYHSVRLNHIGVELEGLNIVSRPACWSTLGTDENLLVGIESSEKQRSSWGQ